MNTIQISDDLKNMLDSLVSQGFAANAAEALEAAVRRCTAELDEWNDALKPAVEAGLSDMRNGDYVVIDGAESRKVFWDGVMREVDEAVAEAESHAKRSAR